MHRTKLLFLLPLWRRPEITEICFLGLDRLRGGDYDIKVVAVISEESMIPLCEKHKINYTFHTNDPLGRKKNFGLAHAYKYVWDYLIELGSDDIFKNEFLKTYAPYFGRHNVLGMDHFIYLNSEDGACRRYQTKNSFGLGRAIHRGVIDKLGPKLWKDEITRGMDNNSMFYLARHGFLEKKVKSEIPLAIDIKSPVNIWPFNYLIGYEYSLKDTLKGLSSAEVSAINNLIGVTV